MIFQWYIQLQWRVNYQQDRKKKEFTSKWITYRMWNVIGALNGHSFFWTLTLIHNFGYMPGLWQSMAFFWSFTIRGIFRMSYCGWQETLFIFEQLIMRIADLWKRKVHIYWCWLKWPQIFLNFDPGSTYPQFWCDFKTRVFKIINKKTWKGQMFFLMPISSASGIKMSVF